MKSNNSQCCFQTMIQKNLILRKNKIPFLESCKNTTVYMNESYTKYSKLNKRGIPVDIDDSIT